MDTPSNKGFTLIELLVVIAIIGVLAGVVLASLNVAREKARDAQRQSDIQQISKALELYYLDNGRYPSEVWCDSSRGSTNAGPCNTNTSGNAWDVTSGIYLGLVPNYIPALPVDPINDTTYFYYYEPVSVGAAVGSDYCLNAKLEGGGDFEIKNGNPPGGGC